MPALTSRIIGTGVLFVVVFLFGFWLNRSGRPVNTIILAIHKLIALGTLIFIGVTIYQVNQVTPLSAAPIITTVVTGILFVVTIITGGLLSLEQPVTAVAIVHKVGPFLTVASTIVTMIFLANPQQ
jgi:hypothetical protein